MMVDYATTSTQSPSQHSTTTVTEPTTTQQTDDPGRCS